MFRVTPEPMKTRRERSIRGQKRVQTLVFFEQPPMYDTKEEETRMEKGIICCNHSTRWHCSGTRWIRVFRLLYARLAVEWINILPFLLFIIFLNTPWMEGSGSAACAHFDFRHGFHLSHSFPTMNNNAAHGMNGQPASAKPLSQRNTCFHMLAGMCIIAVAALARVVFADVPHGLLFADIAARHRGYNLRLRVLSFVLSVRHAARSHRDGRLAFYDADRPSFVGRLAEKTCSLGDA